jgi:hypothetical protein
MRKTLTCFVSGVAAVSLASAASSAVVYDGFDYVDNSAISGQNGGTGWAGSWGGAANYLATDAGLSYGSLITTDGAVDRNAGGFGSIFRDVSSSTIAGAGQPADVVYFSYLFTNIDSTTQNSDTNGLDGLFLQDGATERFRVLFTNGQGITIEAVTTGGGATLSASSANGLDFTSPTFVVGKIDLGDNDLGSFDLWINPADLTDIESETPFLSLTEANTTNEFNGFTLARFGLAGATDQNYVLDEFRFAFGDSNDISSADVAPVPEPATLALAGLGGALVLLRRRSA